MHRQRELPFRTWGGKRSRAGRKPKAGRARVSHCIRPSHCERHPVHITLRAGRLSNLRKQLVFFEMRGALRKTVRSWFRILHFSAQTNHVHMLVEARDKTSLSRGVSGASVRLARAVNRVLGRRGAVWSDRYHARALRTPREVRNGLVYVLMNRLKHVPLARGLDACSSAALFDGWKVPPASGPPPQGLLDDAPIQRPESWLARIGWKRHGLISPNERPKAAL
jgi:putative transposase